MRKRVKCQTTPKLICLFYFLDNWYSLRACLAATGNPYVPYVLPLLVDSTLKPLLFLIFVAYFNP